MREFTFKKYVAPFGLQVLALAAIAQAPTITNEPLIPAYKRTSYARQSVELKNNQIDLRLFKRLDGWGWGEVYTPSGKLMAVMDHLGEIMIRDQDIPMRLAADFYRKSTDTNGNESLIFEVKAVVVRDKLKGTSFQEWMSYPNTEPCLVGEVTLTLIKDKPLINLKYRLKATGNYSARYIRGPWLKVGEGSFGIKKDDSMLPGIEWTINDEWSSGIDWFKDPWAMRSVPHPNQLTMPLMALSYQGTGIGLSWEANKTVARWFNFRDQKAQPVFATPNFIDRMNNNLMGLMIPDATAEGHQNEVIAGLPLELRIGEEINFDAELWLSKGTSLDVVTDWITRQGLPKEAPRWTYKQTLDNIANAYNTNLWHQGEGFGIKQREADKFSTRAPEFLARYINENKSTKLAKELQKKLDWCATQTKAGSKAKTNNVQDLEKQGDYLLKIQREDGSFYFDPDGRHYGKDDFRVATSFVEPMGLAFDTALDMCMTPALQLLDIAKKTGEEKYKAAAKKALDYCLQMTRPEGGDYWETPLHAPNLLAAGHAAVAYYQGYLAFNDAAYKQKAIQWIRSVLPFTNLWEPADVKNLYNTKPCFSSSDWYFANWVRDHVQWEILSVFSISASYHIDWAKVDPGIDWDTYHQGITNAAIRWMNIHTDDNWRPHNIPSTFDAYKRGDFDYCFPDTHNSITGNYGGMFIPPETIANNIYSIMDTNKK